MKWLAIILMIFSISAHAQKHDEFIKIRTLKITLISLTALDLGTTIYGINHGLEESNPAMPKNLVGISAVKAITTTYICLITNENTRGSKAILIGLNILYGAVSANNINLILRLQ